MRKIFIVTVFGLLGQINIASASAPDGHTCAVVVSTSDGFLAVRKASSAEGLLVGKLKPKDFVDVDACTATLCKENPWRRIEHVSWAVDPDGTHPISGWVNSKYLKAVDCGDEP